MAVDSVGKSEQQLLYERRRLEEERKHDIEKVEANRKEQLAKLNEAKDRELERVYENQSSQVSDAQSDADYNVERAKAQADAQVRTFEREAARMTDQAKRKFQEKAHTLQQTAENMDKERALMMKHHGDTMRKLKEQRDQHSYDTNQKAQREAMKVYANREQQIKELNRKTDQELHQRKNEAADRKAAVKRESQLEIASLLNERETTTDGLRKEIQQREAAAQDTLQRKIGDYESMETLQRLEHEDRLANLTRESKRQMNTTHSSGKKKLFDAKQFYTDEEMTLGKQHREKMRQTENQNTVTMAQIESEARLRQDVAQKAFRMKEQAYQQQREQMLAEASTKNEALHKQVSEEFTKQSKEMQSTRKEALLKQNEQMQADILAARKKGEQQLNAAVKKDIINVSTHNHKARDSFYRVHAMNTQITDNENEVVLKVKVPEHEQEMIRLATNDGKLSISGSRRFQDKTITEEGRTVASNSYQSYSESFPVRGKLEMKKMTKSYDGGVLTFKIPKG